MALTAVEDVEGAIIEPGPTSGMSMVISKTWGEISRRWKRMMLTTDGI
jgi:hypothetical protein